MIGTGKTNILVVDDEEYICNIIVEALSSDDYNVVSISDPKAALEYIEQNQVDLLLTDLVMGEYSGMQMIEATMEHHRDAIVILMTAHPTVQTAISVLKKGAYDFLVKPFRLELLKATIRRGLEHQQIVRENLHLRGQVEFLKIAGAAGAEIQTEEFLQMVASSCRNEMSATAVGIIEIDPTTGEPMRKVFEGDDSCPEVLDEATVGKFTYSRRTRPMIDSEQITEDGVCMKRSFIYQPIYARGKLHGVINVLIKSRFDELTPGQIDILTILANSAAYTIANYRLYEDLRTSYLQAIRGLANAIEARDECTAGHTDRVSRLAEQTAEYMGWKGRKIEQLLMGCTLHDIGKIGVPDSILNKPGRLTAEERRRMESHPELGLRIIAGIDLFRPAIPYIMGHHEWFDGSGYPKGLRGKEIPIEGRLLAVVDTFDANLSNRPYREGANLERAVSELIKFRGTQFDPEIVDLFIEVIREGKIDFVKMYDREEDLGILDGIAVTEKAPV